MPLWITAVVLALAVAGLGYALRAKHAGRCAACGRGLMAGTSLRSCAGGHKLHRSCAKYAMDRDAMTREVCPICGIYVSEFAGSPPVLSDC
jgi:hypothetical protein